MDIPVPSKHICSFYLDDELVLFSERTRQLYHFNGSAACIWACLEEGYGIGETVSRLSDIFGIDESRAQSDVETAISGWRDLGLVGVSRDVMEKSSDNSIAPDFPTDTDRMVVSSTADWLYRSYSLVNTIFEIRFSDERLSELVHPLFAHLEIDSNESPDATVDVVRNADETFTIAQNGLIFGECEYENEVAPLVHACFLLAVYALGDSLIAFHAAVVCDGGNCVLMPGTSGSGKSTLTAALIHAGFDYGTDEIALVTPETGEVYTVPLSIGLKEGSWEVLGGRVPGLMDLPVHLRADEKTVRYLSPGVERISDAAIKGTQIDAIIFPVFDVDSDTTMTKMTPGQVLCELARAGYDMEGGLSIDRVSNLLAWIKRRNAYELRYSDLTYAMARVREIPK